MLKMESTTRSYASALHACRENFRQDATTNSASQRSVAFTEAASLEGDQGCLMLFLLAREGWPTCQAGISAGR